MFHPTFEYLNKNLTIALTFFISISCDSVKDSENKFSPQNFNDEWEFLIADEKNISIDEIQSDSSIEWEKISLPHTAKLEPLVIQNQQWQGVSFYKKSFQLGSENSGKHITLRFEAAMHESEIYLNGKRISYNVGGYLPFIVDLSEELKFDDANVLIVKLTNTDNSEIPPGKPIADLDFNYFGGIYRDVWLNIDDRFRISDPIEADRIAGGGVLVSYKEVSNKSAKVVAQVDIVNERSLLAKGIIKVKLIDSNGKIVASQERNVSVNSDNFELTTLELDVENPQLWSPSNPNLYRLRVELTENEEVIDVYEERIGIRTIGFDDQNQFVLNGERLYLRGTNRHQEYPYIGYALSNEANYRDAYKIKEAGFNFIRTAHYPPDPSFLDACDELGILFMDAIPGWQFYGNEIFQERAITDIRTMIRRDRNHSSVIIWEASLNESDMPKAFMDRAHATVKEELPIHEVFTSGWLDYAYDIFIPARQHAKPPEYWGGYPKDKPLFIAEYGDWEYYAQNAGFNQTAFKDLKEDERNSRQLRSAGQTRLLQQALNFQEAHNSNLKGNSFGDANWLMFDYNRGYAPDIEASGIMDIFRIPKFAYYFYQSQISPDSGKAFESHRKPMVYIANYWSEPNVSEIKVFSNAQEVALIINGEEISRKTPDTDRVSSHLEYPPFTFKVDAFIPGEIKADAFIDGKVVASHIRRTPNKASRIALEVDISGKELRNGVNDVVFVYAKIVDSEGTWVSEANNLVMFEIEGDGQLIGENPIHAEAGIATILLKAGANSDEIKVTAISKNISSDTIKVISH